MSLSRRGFLAGTAAAGAAFAAPGIVRAARPRVVVIGGGAGGATAARYLAKDSKGAIDVTLIEPSKRYYTCFFSNLYLGGFRSLESIGHGYGTLAARYGVNVVHDWATAVDRDAKTVRLATGVDVSYDRLILSPGIDFDYAKTTPGYGPAAQSKMPHAWKAGTQTALLKAQIEAMPEGGLFMMVAPPDPYRCPPGPYERVSMIAHLLKQNNPKAKIIVLDPKEKFSKQALFQEGWSKHYKDMVEWIPASIAGRITRIDADEMVVEADVDSFRPAVANVIPAQRAGEIARQAGLTDETGFCPIAPATMASRMDADIHVLGDATIAGDMPKSGFSANSQAKVAAMSVRAGLTESRVFPARFANTCWSLISPDNGVKVGARYEPTEEKIAKTDGFISATGEAADLRKRTYEESLGWYDGIVNDMFA